MVGIVKQTKCMIKYVGGKIGKEYEILKYSAMEWMTKEHKTEGEQKLPIVMANR